jgi:hypothetical protein
MVRSFWFTVQARSGEGARPLRGQTRSMTREDASAVIMGIIGLSLLSLSCPSPLWQELVRNIYPTAAPVRNPFSITSLRPCQ